MGGAAAAHAAPPFCLPCPRYCPLLPPGTRRTSCARRLATRVLAPPPTTAIGYLRVGLRTATVRPVKCAGSTAFRVPACLPPSPAQESLSTTVYLCSAMPRPLVQVKSPSVSCKACPGPPHSTCQRRLKSVTVHPGTTPAPLPARSTSTRCVLPHTPAMSSLSSQSRVPDTATACCANLPCRYPLPDLAAIGTCALALAPPCSWALTSSGRPSMLPARCPLAKRAASAGTPTRRRWVAVPVLLCLCSSLPCAQRFPLLACILSSLAAQLCHCHTNRLSSLCLPTSAQLPLPATSCMHPFWPTLPVPQSFKHIFHTIAGTCTGHTFPSCWPAGGRCAPVDVCDGLEDSACSSATLVDGGDVVGACACA
jgi:hypothetical protein